MGGDAEAIQETCGQVVLHAVQRSIKLGKWIDETKRAQIIFRKLGINQSQHCHYSRLL